VAFIVAVFIGAVAAIPFFYLYRMNAGIFAGGIFTFIGVPLVFGVLLKHGHRIVTLGAIVLLLVCPLVYVAFDFAEKLRDGSFLAIGSTILFVSATWISDSVRSRRWGRCAIAINGILSSAVALFILLWMTVYFE
jgi:hypothetical protein